MSFIVINTTNAFDPIHQLVFATNESADAQAREILTTQPQAIVRTAKLLATYSAQVVITAGPVSEVAADPAD